LKPVLEIMNREGIASGRAAKYTVKRLLRFKGTQLPYFPQHEEFPFSRSAWECDLIGAIPAAGEVKHLAIPRRRYACPDQRFPQISRLEGGK
jgi:hypothetical protein